MAELIQGTDSLNTGREKINNAITQSNQAINTANNAMGSVDEAVDTANQAKATADQTRTEFNQITNNDTTALGGQLSVGSDGTVYTDAQTRFIEEYNNTSKKGELVINTKDFGAKGDGATDDTIAIQSAIDYANSLGGGKVLFPKGNFVQSATLTIPPKVILEGVGRSLSVLIAITDGMTMIEMVSGAITRTYNEINSIGFKASVANVTAIKTVMSSGLIFENLFFGGLMYNFNLDRGSNFQISKILVEGTPILKAGKSIFQDTVKNDHIYDIQISDYQIRNIGNGVQSPAMEFNRAVGTFLNEFRSSDLGMANGVLYSGDCQGCKISNSIIVHSNEYAIKYILEGATSPIAMTITDVDIDQAQLNGIQIDAGHWITVNGGHITTIGQHGISCGIGNVNDAGNIFILGVNIVDCTNQGIQIAPNTGAFNIFNSHIEQTDCAILISAGTSDNYIIQNNDLSALNTNKIVDGGTGINKLIGNNLGINNSYKKEYTSSVVKTLVGGATSETVSVTIPNGLFSEKPNFGILTEESNSTQRLIGYYQFDNASNGATSAYFTIVNNAGTAITAGTYRFGVFLKS